TWGGIGQQTSQSRRRHSAHPRGRAWDSEETLQDRSLARTVPRKILNKAQSRRIEEVHYDAWLVSFMDYDFGIFRSRDPVPEPLANPFGPVGRHLCSRYGVLPMSSGRTQIFWRTRRDLNRRTSDPKSTLRVYSESPQSPAISKIARKITVFWKPDPEHLPVSLDFTGCTAYIAPTWRT